MEKLIKRLKVVLSTLEDVGSVTIPPKVFPELRSIIRDMADQMAEKTARSRLFHNFKDIAQDLDETDGDKPMVWDDDEG
ncbi:MAG: hypothetical protein H8E12_20780 [Rhodobacteraceae bacterium]|nr:hypothetical protein [Paracoccaceae bacterium]